MRYPSNFLEGVTIPLVVERQRRAPCWSPFSNRAVERDEREGEDVIRGA
jgi:hypothetical protein